MSRKLTLTKNNIFDSVLPNKGVNQNDVLTIFRSCENLLVEITFYILGYDCTI